MNTISAAILSGGLATRINGASKSELLINGMRILDIQYSILSPLFEEIFLVANSPISNHSMQQIGDIHHNIGPLGGIHSALVHATFSQVFIVSCDMPFLNSTFIRWLLDVPNREQYDIIIPHHHIGIEPLHAVYSKTCIPTIENQIQQKQYSIRTFFPKMKVLQREVPKEFSPEELFFNINYPHDILKANEYGKRMEPNPSRKHSKGI